MSYKQYKMNMLKQTSYILSAIIGSLLFACVEEIDLTQQLTFEDAIVVEATITNELKIQRIFISRTYKFEDNGPTAESGAQVSISMNDNSLINFYEDSPGNYLSSTAFKAEPGIEYQLQIQTSKGRSYISKKVPISKAIQIEKLYATREINSIGTEILSINVDSYDPDNESNYYRYEYEETYEIVAPKWVDKDFILLPGPAPGFGPRPIEQKVCYNAMASNTIIQTSTTNFFEDRVSKFPVRAIASNDPIIGHTYSILVKQYIQSLEAYTYFNVLDQLSGSGSLFSQIQPGYFNSNIISTEDKNEKVLGFFEVTSVSEKRIFVNYEDLFPGEEKPPYFNECDTYAPQILAELATPLRNAIESGQVKYYKGNGDQGEFEGPYDVVDTPCGDCTVYGTSEKPDFWED